MNIEQQIKPNINIEKEKLERKNIKELFFQELIQSKLVDSFKEALNATGFNEKEQDNFFNELSKLSSPDRENNILAVPWELKMRALTYARKAIDDNKMNIKTLAENIKKIVSINNFIVAYHATKNNIEPTEKYSPTMGTERSWVAKGTEKDHRDDDLPMAYFSKTYNDIYRTKSPKNLYLVAPTGKSSRHDGERGRASSLDIITKIDLKEADEIIEEKTKNYLAELNKKEENDKLAT